MSNLEGVGGGIALSLSPIAFSLPLSLRVGKTGGNSETQDDDGSAHVIHSAAAALARGNGT